MARWGKTKDLSVAQQLENLRANPLSARSGWLCRGRLVWRCDLSPTPFSRTYTVRIEYAHGDRPKVYVESPNLRELAGEREIPHLYSQEEQRLCLYLPHSGEWNRSMLFDRTIIPWSVMWLFYFEDWLLSGEWRGGGTHPVGNGDESETET